MWHFKQAPWYICKRRQATLYTMKRKASKRRNNNRTKVLNNKSLLLHKLRRIALSWFAYLPSTTGSFVRQIDLLCAKSADHSRSCERWISCFVSDTAYQKEQSYSSRHTSHLWTWFQLFSFPLHFRLSPWSNRTAWKYTSACWQRFHQPSLQSSAR